MAPSGAKHVVLLLLFFGAFCTSEAYKTIVYVHGILASYTECSDLKIYIQKAHPGTNIISINAYNNLASLEPLWKQVQNIAFQMQEIMKANPDGIHLICFSQGGIICRGLLQIMPNHNVDTFISLSGPLAGQYGLTDFLKPFLPKVSKELAYEVFYTEIGQNVSVANYWYDPHHLDRFKQEGLNIFLAVLNNQTKNDASQAYKNNFLRLKKLVLIGGKDDGVITPWQSSHFGTFDEKENIKEMTDQDFYIHDSFGLQTMVKRGAVKLHEISGVEHIKWHANISVFNCCIEPWLT